MKFADNKNLYIRRALFILVVVFAAVLQHTKGAMPSVFGARVLLLIPVTVCIAMYEKSMGGLVIGVLSGVLWDFATVRGDGFYAVMLALAGYTAGVVVTHFMRNNIFSALLLSLGACLFVTTGYWLIFILIRGYEGAWGALLHFYLPSALYSLAFTPVFYYPISFIYKLTARKKQRRHY